MTGVQLLIDTGFHDGQRLIRWCAVGNWHMAALNDFWELSMWPCLLAYYHGEFYFLQNVKPSRSRWNCFADITLLRSHHYVTYSRCPLERMRTMYGKWNYLKYLNGIVLPYLKLLIRAWVYMVMCASHVSIAYHWLSSRLKNLQCVINGDMLIWQSCTKSSVWFGIIKPGNAITDLLTENIVLWPLDIIDRSQCLLCYWNCRRKNCFLIIYSCYSMVSVIVYIHKWLHASH